MKKIILLGVSLIGLAFSSRVFAQHDLDIVNNTSCSFTVNATQYDPPANCNSTSNQSTTIAASSSVTFVSIIPTDYVLKCTVSNNCDAGTPVSDFTMCSGPFNLTTTLNTSSCCPANVNVTFTGPTATANAIVTIN